MSLQFFGWEVTYDDESPSVELTASQAPKDKGVYTMYHGTSIANARRIIANGFQQSQGGMLGKGVYVSRDKKKAERYPLNNSPADRVVLKLHVRVGRVKRIDKDNHPMQYTWSTQGYDTAWVPPNCGMKAVPSGLEEDCVFDPKRVTVVGIHSSLHSLQCILLTVLSRVSATGQLVHSTVQQRPLQSHKLSQPFNIQTM
uniref:Grass carp reovirus (GCRV)-induced gene 2p n=1 Tax=Neolamprologus brichardi TaxID=32507 RepID=A0A3Q4FYZ9_NEOBR